MLVIRYFTSNYDSGGVQMQLQGAILFIGILLPDIIYSLSFNGVRVIRMIGHRMGFGRNHGDHFISFVTVGLARHRTDLRLDDSAA
jgi:hypothetical protein